MCTPVVAITALASTLAGSLLMKPRSQDAPPLPPIDKPMNQEETPTKHAEIDPGTGEEGVAKDKTRKQKQVTKTGDLKTQPRNIGLSIGNTGRTDPTGVSLGKPTAPTP